MGLCASCLNQGVGEQEVELEPRIPVQKIRPLLADLEADFAEFAGDDGVLDAKELCNIWKKCAARKVGKLTDDDAKLIEKSSRDYFKQLDLGNDGKVSYEEFVTHMLGASESRGPLSDMRAQLVDGLKKDPTKLKVLIENFKKWDKNGDGFVTPEELDQHLSELDFMVGGEVDPTKSQQLQDNLDKARSIREEIFREADVDQDGRVDLWEVMAHMLGRRKMPVEVLVYDISKGMADKLGTLLIGKKVAALHSGLLIYGSEYWYGGQIFRSEPPCRAAFGEPLKKPWDTPLPMSVQRPDLPVVPIGYTFVTHREFTTWIKKEVTHRYRDIEQYDLLTHSCNHFTNEAINFLTGGSIPDKIMELQRMALTPAMMAMRPHLNKYLGGFGDAGKNIDDHYFTVDALPDMRRSTSQAADFKDVFDSGEVVLVEGVKGASGAVVATILSQVDDKCEIKFFDGVTGEIKTESGIKVSQIKPISED